MSKQECFNYLKCFDVNHAFRFMNFIEENNFFKRYGDG